MQVDPRYPAHINTKECRMGTARCHQQDMAVQSALVHGNMLERVEVFRYLGRLLSQDDDDIQAVRSQLRKVRGTWARIGQVLRKENASPRVSAKFYKAIVQSVLLYGSEIAQPLWQGLRGSISARCIGWQRNMCLGGGHVSSGSTHPRIRCWRSAECTPLNTTSMCGGSRSQSM